MSTIKYTRNTDGNFVCPHCNVVKNKQNTMHYHIKRNHEKNFPFECKQCSENPKFLQRSSYLHHLATNHPENPHPTETEKNQYATTEFACPCCTHKTHTKANVIIHYARTHCNEWIPSYAKDTNCTGCMKTFHSSSAYLYHSVSCFLKNATPDQANTLSRIK
jgi:hypothetical protein